MDIRSDRLEELMKRDWSGYLLPTSVTQVGRRDLEVGQVWTAARSGEGAAVVVISGDETAIVLCGTYRHYKRGMELAWYADSRATHSVLVQDASDHYGRENRRTVAQVHRRAYTRVTPFAKGQVRRGTIYMCDDFESIYESNTTFVLDKPCTSTEQRGYWSVKGDTIIVHPDWETEVVGGVKEPLGAPVAKAVGGAHVFDDPYLVAKCNGRLDRLCKNCGIIELSSGARACTPDPNWRARREDDIRDTMLGRDARRVPVELGASPLRFRQSHPLLAGGVFSLREQKPPRLT